MLIMSSVMLGYLGNIQEVTDENTEKLQSYKFVDCSDEWSKIDTSKAKESIEEASQSVTLA